MENILPIDQYNEPILIKGKELVKVAEKNGLTLLVAQQHAEAFMPSLIEAVRLSQDLLKMDKNNPSEEDAKTARRNRLDLVKVRTGSKGIEESRKKDLNTEKDLIIDLNKVVWATSQESERQYEEIEKYAERKEATRIEELKEQRLVALAPYEVDSKYIPLGKISQEEFDTLFNDSKIIFEAKAAAKKKQEEEEAKAKEVAEKEAQDKLKADKLERDRILKENEEIKAQQEKDKKEALIEKQKQDAKLKEVQDKADEEKKKQDAIIKAEQDENKRLKDEAHARIKADNDAKILANQKAELELSKGDEAKMKDLIADLEALQAKYSFKSTKFKILFNRIIGLLEKIINYTKEKM